MGIEGRVCIVFGMCECIRMQKIASIKGHCDVYLIAVHVSIKYFQNHAFQNLHFFFEQNILKSYPLQGSHMLEKYFNKGSFLGN